MQKVSWKVRMKLGINVDWVHGFSVEEVLATGCEVVRFPLWEDTGFDYVELLKNLSGNNITDIRTMAVLDRRAFPTNKYASRMRYYKKKYDGLVTWWQVGNEPDQPNSESSWYMTPRSLKSLLHSARGIFGDKLINPGLVSGQPSYARSVGLKQLTLHPYGQRPELYWPSSSWGFSYVGDLFRVYEEQVTYVTEFGAQLALLDNEHQQAEYVTKMIRALNSFGIKIACYFCYSDLMNDGFGLVRADGTPKEVYAAFHDSRW